MILPPSGIEASGDEASLADATDRFFRPDGGLAAACRGEPFPYEPRPQQRQMAAAVAAALARGRHLMVEAGTGVGKSFAYLVPLILATRERNAKAVVSTWTISLQEQLYQKDIPFLRRHLGEPFEAALVIGRSNYLCRRRLARAIAGAATLFGDEEARWLRRLAEWATEAKGGTLQEMPRQPPPAVWDAVCAEQETCRSRDCEHASGCFFMRARRRAHAADLLVVNHHLLMADLALRLTRRPVLPEYAALVLDEAHQLEDAASDHFGIHLTEYAVERLIWRLWRPDTRRGLLASLRAAAACHAAEAAKEATTRLFAELEDVAPAEGQSARRLAKPPAVETAAVERLRDLAGELQELAKGQDDPDTQGEIRQAMMRALGLAEWLETFLSQSAGDQVYWTERTGRRRRLALRSAPIEVGPLLRMALFEQGPPVVLTSATMAVGGTFDFFISRLGVGECDTLSVGSPFDHARQMRILLPRRMPDPNAADFTDAAADAIEWLAAANGGSTFALFTNAAQMRRVAGRIRPGLEHRGLTLLVQGEGTPRHQMLEQFKAGKGMVLLGLDSFWMGVDVRGDALSQVIIARLPFSVPDDPVVQARIERIEARGGDPFREFSLPAAVIKFRQGVGRLIRTATDTGRVVVLDRRLIEKWYGRWFLQSLPDCPLETIEMPAGGEPTG